MDVFLFQWLCSRSVTYNRSAIAAYAADAGFSGFAAGQLLITISSGRDMLFTAVVSVALQPVSYL